MKFNFAYFRQFDGMFKLAEWVLNIILVLLMRFSMFPIKDSGANMLVTGTTVAFSLIFSSTIINYVFGGGMSILEIILDSFGIVLFIAAGGVSIAASQESSSSAYMALGVFSLLTAGVLIGDLVNELRHITVRFNVNVAYFRTFDGIFKAAQWVLTIILVMIIRFSGFRITDIDANMLITGTTVAFSIIISSVILNYVLLGGSMSILEIVLDFFGILLFIASGAVSIYASQNLSGIITSMDKFVVNLSDIVGGFTGYDGLDNIYNGGKGILGLDNHDTNTAMGAFIAIGVLSFLTAGVFVIDFTMKMKNTKFSLK